MREAVCVLLQNAEGEILSISRPHDRDDVGLIGGSIEPMDGDLARDPDATRRRAAARELWEEAGLRLSPEHLIPVFVAAVGRTRVTTFVPAAPITAAPVLGQNIEGWVRWATAAEICAGRYGAYNQDLLAALASAPPSGSAQRSTSS